MKSLEEILGKILGKILGNLALKVIDQSRYVSRIFREVFEKLTILHGSKSVLSTFFLPLRKSIDFWTSHYLPFLRTYNQIQTNLDVELIRKPIERVNLDLALMQKFYNFHVKHIEYDYSLIGSPYLHFLKILGHLLTNWVIESIKNHSKEKEPTFALSICLSTSKKDSILFNRSFLIKKKDLEDITDPETETIKKEFLQELLANRIQHYLHALFSSKFYDLSTIDFISLIFVENVENPLISKAVPKKELFIENYSSELSSVSSKNSDDVSVSTAVDATEIIEKKSKKKDNVNDVSLSTAIDATEIIEKKEKKKKKDTLNDVSNLTTRNSTERKETKEKKKKKEQKSACREIYHYILDFKKNHLQILEFHLENELTTYKEVASLSDFLDSLDFQKFHTTYLYISNFQEYNPILIKILKEYVNDNFLLNLSYNKAIDGKKDLDENLLKKSFFSSILLTYPYLSKMEDSEKQKLKIESSNSFFHFKPVYESFLMSEKKEIFEKTLGETEGKERLEKILKIMKIHSLLLGPHAYFHSISFTAMLRQYFPKKTRKKDEEKKEKSSHLLLRNYARNSFRGGLIYKDPEMERNTVVKNMRISDVISLYPFCMSENFSFFNVDTSFFSTSNDMTFEEIEKKNWIGFLKIQIQILKKTLPSTLLSLLPFLEGPFQKTTEKKTLSTLLGENFKVEYISHDKVITYLTTAEVSFLRKNHPEELHFTFIDGYLSEPISSPFQPFLTKFFSRKELSTSPIEKNFAKYVLNILSGLLSKREEPLERVLYTRANSEKTITFERKTPNLYVTFGSFITAYGRLFMYQMIQLLIQQGGHLFYCHTDSLYYKSIQPFLENLQKEEDRNKNDVMKLLGKNKQEKDLFTFFFGATNNYGLFNQKTSAWIIKGSFQPPKN